MSAAAPVVPSPLAHPSTSARTLGLRTHPRSHQQIQLGFSRHTSSFSSSSSSSSSASLQPMPQGTSLALAARGLWRPSVGRGFSSVGVGIGSGVGSGVGSGGFGGGNSVGGRQLNQLECRGHTRHPSASPAPQHMPRLRGFASATRGLEQPSPVGVGAPGGGGGGRGARTLSAVGGRASQISPVTSCVVQRILNPSLLDSIAII
jgi:hypothetical protein